MYTFFWGSRNLERGEGRGGQVTLCIFQILGLKQGCILKSSLPSANTLAHPKASTLDLCFVPGPNLYSQFHGFSEVSHQSPSRRGGSQIWVQNSQPQKTKRGCSDNFSYQLFYFETPLRNSEPFSIFTPTSKLKNN